MRVKEGFVSMCPFLNRFFVDEGLVRVESELARFWSSFFVGGFRREDRVFPRKYTRKQTLRK